MLLKMRLCLTCPAMMARETPSLLEGLDELRQLAQRKPMHRRRAALLDLGRGLFFDRGDHDLHSLRARRIEHQEREFAVAGDQADTL